VERAQASTVPSFAGFLFVRPTKLDPIPSGFEHGVHVVNAARVVEQDGLAHRTNEDLYTVLFIDVHRVLGCSGWRLEHPGIAFGSIERCHAFPLSTDRIKLVPPQ